MWGQRLYRPILQNSHKRHGTPGSIATRSPEYDGGHRDSTYMHDKAQIN